LAVGLLAATGALLKKQMQYRYSHGIGKRLLFPVYLYTCISFYVCINSSGPKPYRITTLLNGHIAVGHQMAQDKAVFLLEAYV